MSEVPLYPLRFDPIYQYRLWGGRRLANLLSAPLPEDVPIGEAWVLSDRSDNSSRVSNGPLKGWTIGELMEAYQRPLMGKWASCFNRFPLLLKFLDAEKMLSVQVHPGDAHRDLIPTGDTGKTEAWVVIDAQKDSLIYAGLKPGTTEIELRESLANGTIVDHLAGITPKPGDGVFIPAGTVHSLGGGVVVFEVQQNSDVTFRLYDWGHVDPKTGQLRTLQVDQALASIDFDGFAGGLVVPHVETTSPVEREKIFDCEHFRLYRLLGQAPFPVGAADEPHMLICIAGAGRIEHNALPYSVGKGDVWILPAEAGECVFRPSEEITMLEIAIPG